MAISVKNEEGHLIVTPDVRCPPETGHERSSLSVQSRLWPAQRPHPPACRSSKPEAPGTAWVIIFSMTPKIAQTLHFSCLFMDKRHCLKVTFNIQ